MVALLDVNVLIALLDVDHIHHRQATAWFSAYASNGWASCPITENGCIRVMSQTGYPNPLPTAAVVERLGQATRHRRHRFWPDDISLLDRKTLSGPILGPRQVTDLYLIALAVKHQGCLATFDDNIPVTLIARATKRHLIVI